MNDNLIKETISDNTTTTTKSIINGSSFLYKNIDVGQDKPLNVVETLNSGDLATDVMFTDQELKVNTLTHSLSTDHWPNLDNKIYSPYILRVNIFAFFFFLYCHTSSFGYLLFCFHIS